MWPGGKKPFPFLKRGDGLKRFMVPGLSPRPETARTASSRDGGGGAARPRTAETADSGLPKSPFYPSPNNFEEAGVRESDNVPKEPLFASTPVASPRSSKESTPEVSEDSFTSLNRVPITHPVTPSLETTSEIAISARDVPVRKSLENLNSILLESCSDYHGSSKKLENSKRHVVQKDPDSPIHDPPVPREHHQHRLRRRQKSLALKTPVAHKSVSAHVPSPKKSLGPSEILETFLPNRDRCRPVAPSQIFTPRIKPESRPEALATTRMKEIEQVSGQLQAMLCLLDCGKHRLNELIDKVIDKARSEEVCKRACTEDALKKLKESREKEAYDFSVKLAAKDREIQTLRCNMRLNGDKSKGTHAKNAELLAEVQSLKEKLVKSQSDASNLRVQMREMQKRLKDTTDELEVEKERTRKRNDRIASLERQLEKQREIQKINENNPPPRPAAAAVTRNRTPLGARNQIPLRRGSSTSDSVFAAEPVRRPMPAPSYLRASSTSSAGSSKKAVHWHEPEADPVSEIEPSQIRESLLDLVPKDARILTAVDCGSCPVDLKKFDWYRIEAVGNRGVYQKRKKCGCECLLFDEGRYVFMTTVHNAKLEFTRQKNFIMYIDGMELRLFPNRQFEIHRERGGTSIISPTGEQFETFLDENGEIAYQEILKNNKWQRLRADGTVDGAARLPSLRSDGTKWEYEDAKPDCPLRIFWHDKFRVVQSRSAEYASAVTIHVFVPGTNQTEYTQIYICPGCSVGQVKHKLRQTTTGQTSESCFTFSSCQHFKGK